MTAAEIGHVQPYLRAADICFDVGAHAGTWTLPLARLVPNGHVYAFEALPYYAGILALMCRWRRQRNITVINKAIGERAGAVSIVSHDAAGRNLTGQTHVAGAGETSNAAAQVGVITLDGFYRELIKRDAGARSPPTVRLVKCDVEGFELPVLRGAVELIEACRPIFFCELFAEYTKRYGYAPADVFAFFHERRYSTLSLNASGEMSPIDADRYSNASDILAVPVEFAPRCGP